MATTVVKARPRVKTIWQNYGSRLRGVVREVMTALREGVVERDIFGLKGGDALAAAPPLLDALSPAEQVRRFMDWLRRQLAALLNTVSRDRNSYIRAAYAAGIRWAHARLRESGFTVSIDDIDRILQMPDHRQTLRLLFARNYRAVTGVIDAVSKQVARELTDGLAANWSPKKLARKLLDRLDKIGLTRLTTLSQTEILHAHNEAALERYRDLGIEEVAIANNSPCERICKPIVENGPYPIDDIPKGGPPFHPNCQGSLAIPV